MNSPNVAPEWKGTLPLGWTVQHAGSAQALLQRLVRKWKRSADNVQTSANALRCEIDLSDFHLWGVGENVRCLLVSGAGADTTRSVKDFWRDTGSRAGIPFIFCVSPESHDEAVAQVPRGSALILAPSQLTHLLQAEESIAILKQYLRQQIGRNRLSPYNVLRPARGTAFFGRVRELAQLREDDQSSFAIAGPGLIGKTSLLLQHKWDLVRRRDPRVSRLEVVDFFSFDDSPGDAAAHFLACRIDSRRGSTLFRAADLVHFFDQTATARGGPLELLLDEVDRVCSGETFKYLGHAAKQGSLRLILCGRKGVWDFARHGNSVLGRRLKLLLPGAIDPPAARDMVCRPLEDLGFAFQDPERVLARVLSMTGRWPHLLQFYCQNIVERALEQGTEVISGDLLTKLESRFEVAQHFLNPLWQLEDKRTRALAAVLLDDAETRFALPHIAALARQLGQEDDPKRLDNVCNELVIHNVLTWEGNSYRVANEALRFFARATGVLPLLKEAQ